MESLYQISADLRNTINILEENGGELTEELEKSLEINQNNLKDKLEDYVKAIKCYENDIDAVKCENTRLSDRKKVLDNRIKKLKDRVLDAVLEFGDITKSGNRAIEIPIARLYTKDSNSIEIDEYKLNCLQNIVLDIIKNKEYNVDNILNLINEEYKSFVDSNNELPFIDKVLVYKPFTFDDLQFLEFTVSKKYTLNELLLNNLGIKDDIANENMLPSQYKIELANNKTDLKSLFENNKDISIATINIKPNLTIK